VAAVAVVRAAPPVGVAVIDDIATKKFGDDDEMMRRRT
jgi:hypothetical protein